MNGANSGENNNRRNSICNGYAGARPRSSSFRFRRPSGSGLGLDEDAAGVQLRRRLENETVCQNFIFFAKVCRPDQDFSSFTNLVIVEITAFYRHISFLTKIP